MSLDRISKVSSNDEDTQAHLYVQQPKNLNNVGLQTTSMPTLTAESNFYIAILNETLLNLIPKATLKGGQTHLYTQQRRNLSNVALVLITFVSN
jgi:hypothetical protein